MKTNRQPKNLNATEPTLKLVWWNPQPVDAYPHYDPQLYPVNATYTATMAQLEACMRGLRRKAKRRAKR